MDGTLLCSWASQKQYMALYVCDIAVVEQHRAKLGTLDVGKSCIRFKKLEDLPMDAVQTILEDSVEQLKNGKSTSC